MAEGLVVSHKYSPLDDSTKTITSVKVGEIVPVKVTVIAPAEHNYVIIEDLLPAGFERGTCASRTSSPP